MKTLKTFLVEVGDSRKPYRFTFKVDFSGHHGSDYIGRFTTDSGIRYTMNALAANPRIFGMTIGFSLRGEFGDKLNITNAGVSDMFRIMATVIAFAKKSVVALKKTHDIDVDKIYFTASGNDKFGENDPKKDKQRLKLYMAFIKKEMKIKQIQKEGNRVVVTI